MQAFLLRGSTGTLGLSLLRRKPQSIRYMVCGTANYQQAALSYERQGRVMLLQRHEVSMNNTSPPDQSDHDVRAPC